MKRKYVGINIQFPISQLILKKEKIIETRTYALPKDFVDQDLLFIETPGKAGRFKSRIVAIIRFGESFKYESEDEFYSDEKKHRVSRGSIWSYDSKKGKWGWPILKITVLKKPSSPKKRLGIKFTKNLVL